MSTDTALTIVGWALITIGVAATVLLVVFRKRPLVRELLALPDPTPAVQGAIDDGDDFDARRGRQGDGAGDEDDGVAAVARGLGEGVAHPPGRAVAQEANGVEMLPRGACSDEDVHVRAPWREANPQRPPRRGWWWRRTRRQGRSSRSREARR